MPSKHMFMLVCYETKTMDGCLYMKEEACSMYSVNSGYSSGETLTQPDSPTMRDKK